ncbi:hypothetical protein BGW41_003410 [Actinomortierella wolfii]|nr:hypothetical protein BGW41_003410 [Actinomortierella wolfii]
MDNQDERSSLVRTNGLNGPREPANHLNNGNSQQAHAGYATISPRTTSAFNNGASGRQDYRNLLAQAQQSLASFQEWAAKSLHKDGADTSLVNWVQSARVARTFVMIINIILTALEVMLREPILDYLIPESATTMLAAGLIVLIGAFGFAIAYNLVVDDGSSLKDSEDGRRDGHHGSGGNGRDPGPQSPIPPPTPSIQHGHPSESMTVQRKTSRRVMLSPASVYLLSATVFFLAITLLVLTYSALQRSSHLSQMDKELESAWSYSYHNHKQFISDFERRHSCCGFARLDDRPIPNEPKKNNTCVQNPSYGFQTPCKDVLSIDYLRWQKGIHHLMVVQLAIMTPLLALYAILAMVGIKKRNGWKQVKQHEEPVLLDLSSESDVGARPVYHPERPLLEGNTENERTPLLTDAAHQSSTTAQERPVVQPSLI